MKLLLDENLSRRIVPALQDAFPGSTQVVLAGLERAADRTLREYAKVNDFVIVTKDDDFTDLLALLGYPPKIILLALGNTSNPAVITALIKAKDEIDAAFASRETGLITIY